MKHRHSHHISEESTIMVKKSLMTGNGSLGSPVGNSSRNNHNTVATSNNSSKFVRCAVFLLILGIVGIWYTNASVPRFLEEMADQAHALRGHLQDDSNQTMVIRPTPPLLQAPHNATTSSLLLTKTIHSLVSDDNKIPDNQNPRPLVEKCQDKPLASKRFFQKPSCGKPLAISTYTSTNLDVQCNANDKALLHALKDQCNEFAIKAISSKTPSRVTLQELHLQQSLQDECWFSSQDASNPQFLYSFDHANARDELLDCTTGVIFPRQLIGYCQCGLFDHYNKTMSYYFSGHSGDQHPEKRTWVQRYSSQPRAQVVFNTAGRNVRKQTGHYDWYGYYAKLRSSEFALCPDGDFTWTYRFLEAIMCGAIPILERKTSPIDVQEEGYHYCLDGEDFDAKCPYVHDAALRQQAAAENWKNFVRRHTLVSEEW